jgi:hypothetical protein
MSSLLKCIQLQSSVWERIPRPTLKWLASVKEFAKELFPDPVLPRRMILMAEKHTGILNLGICIAPTQLFRAALGAESRVYYPSKSADRQTQ